MVKAKHPEGLSVEPASFSNSKEKLGLNQGPSVNHAPTRKRSLVSQLKRWTKKTLEPLGIDLRRSRPLDPEGYPSYSNFNEQARLKAWFQRLQKGHPSLSRTMVDLGAGDGISESNSLGFFEQGFAGAAVEADAERFAALAKRHASRQDIALARTWITPGNVCNLLKALRVPQAFGILSLDLDGYDRFVLAALLQEFSPALVCVEINEKVPPPLRFTILPREDWRWDGSHCYGMSLCEAVELLKPGYALVEVEMNNAFFVQRRLLVTSSAGSPLQVNRDAAFELTPQQAYTEGYLARPERLTRLPWNQDMEFLRELGPEQAVQALHQRFAAYQGFYQLEF